MYNCVCIDTDPHTLTHTHNNYTITVYRIQFYFSVPDRSSFLPGGRPALQWLRKRRRLDLRQPAESRSKWRDVAPATVLDGALVMHTPSPPKNGAFDPKHAGFNPATVGFQPPKWHFKRGFGLEYGEFRRPADESARNRELNQTVGTRWLGLGPTEDQKILSVYAIPG